MLNYNFNMKNMKKIITILSLSISLVACTSDLEELNVNKKDFSITTDAAQFTTAQQKLFTHITETNVNVNIFRLIAQQWTETTYTDESRYILKTRGIDEEHWEVLYREVLKNLQEAKSLVTGIDAVVANKLAILEIYEIYTYYVLVTSFGDIPYTEALNIDILNPVLDKQDAVLYDLLSRIDTNVLANIDITEVGFDVADVVYGGDMSKWKKFANSLKLQMGMLIADVDATRAQTVVAEAVADGVITLSEDDMKLAFETAAPYTNPVYAALVLSGRDDFIPTSTVIDMMNANNDPRRDDYFTLKDGAYVGGAHGELNPYSNFSHVSLKIANDPELAASLMTSYEINFLLAEAVERGYITGTAATYYETAVTHSILYWGGTQAEATTYLSDATVAYATATGDYKQVIGTQKWIALYNRGFEAWTEWRRLDYPVLAAPANAETNNGLPPFRITYPTVELSLNETNIKAAGISIGGDQLETTLFWDINN